MDDLGNKKVKYPIGEHDFGELRRGGCLYVDKTPYVKQLIDQGKFIFLSRPRRFGKSLLLSTIEAYFRGEKELFNGTWLGENETEWEEYPVLHFDMSIACGNDVDEMRAYLHEAIRTYEMRFDLPINDHIADPGRRYNYLINGIFTKLGKQVVILIDEYDNGILETLDAPKKTRNAMSALLRAFYRQPKAATKAVRFCMVTGVARFGNYTLFSGSNNYNDISMNPAFAACCGITQQEILDYFEAGISKFCEENGWTREKTLWVLKLKYDSYRFTKSEELVYNPYSLLLAFNDVNLGDYWIKSGTSKVFVDYLSRSEFDLLELQNLWVDQSRMEATYSSDDAIPLLFQTGYLTIKEFKRDEMGEVLYRLGLPNGEVRSALINQLMPKYMGISLSEFTNSYSDLKKKFTSGDVPGWIGILKSMIADIPYQLFGPKGNAKKKSDKKSTSKDASIARLERTYHIIVHIIFQMLDLDSRSEISVSGGRIDMVAYTDNYVYVIEFKLDRPASEALAQIDDRRYLLKWRAEGRTVYKIGISFSSKHHTIGEYVYER